MSKEDHSLILALRRANEFPVTRGMQSSNLRALNGDAVEETILR